MTLQNKERIAQIKRGEIPKGYKATKVGIVPCEWEQKQIKDICKVASGTTPSRMDNTNFVGENLWVTSGELKSKYLFDTTEKISDVAVASSRLKLYKENTLIIAIYGLEAAGIRGTASIVKKPCTISQACMAFTKLSSTTTDFLYYWYIFNGERIGTQYAQGTKQQNLSVETVNSLKILLPPLAEQEKIAAILSKQDELIELQTKIIAEKQVQKKGLMQFLLTGKKRLKGFSGKWEKKNLAEFIKFISGFPFSSAFFNDNLDGIRIIKNRDLKFDDRIIYTTQPVSDEYIIKNGDLLVGMDGDFTPNLWNKGKAYLNQRVAKITCSAELNIFFLYNAIQEPLKRLQEITGSTTVKHLSISDIGKLKIFIPTLAEQEAIAVVVSSADKEIEILQAKLEEEKRKKKALMQMLLTGKVRVNV